MRTAHGDNLLASLAMLLSAAWVVAWLAGWLGHNPALPLRLTVFVAGLLLGIGVTVLLGVRAQQEGSLIQRYLDALVRLRPQDLCGDCSANVLPTLPSDHPLRQTSERLVEMMRVQAGELQEIQHARGSLEVRCQRATAQHEQIRAILAGVDDPIIAADDHDAMLLANPSAQAVLGIDLEQTESRLLSQLVRCEELIELLGSAARRKTPGNRTSEIELPDEHGQPRWYRVTTKRLVTEGQDPQHPQTDWGAVAVLRDIGVEKVLQKRNAEFVSAVSHEMKTPLAAIRAYVELLVDGDADDEKTREEFLEIINSQADRLRRLVDNLLNLARIETGVINVNKQDQSLNEILEEALRVVQPAAEAKRIELAGELSPLYLGVFADRDLLLQAAINLLSNAVKYTPDGGRVALRSRLEDQEVRFEVEDTGVGLSEEDCHRVFEKFYRVKASKDMAPGTGLGLALAKHIVEDVHGGSLGVASVLGKGSTFAITLPSTGKMT